MASENISVPHHGTRPGPRRRAAQALTGAQTANAEPIPAMALSPALNAFAQSTGLQLVYGPKSPTA